MKKILCCCKRLEVQVILAIILGIFSGLYLGNINPNSFWAFLNVENVFWMGDIFMKLLKVFLGPLLFFSIVTAIIGLGDLKKLGSIGIRTISYYIITTVIAILLSLSMINIFKPGEISKLDFQKELNSAGNEPLSFSNFVLGLIPDNFLQSFLDLNAMQIVIMGIALGIALIATKRKNEVESVNIIFSTLNDAILQFISFVIKLTPFGVFAIVAKIIHENGIGSLEGIFPFVIVITAAILIHAFILLPIFGYIFGGFNPYKYLKQVKEPLILGFSTASSSATLGLTMTTAKEKANLNEDVVNFSIPLGSTINMNGTALYQAGAALFVAQAIGMSLGITDQLTVIAVVVLASIGAAGVPGAGILILTTVFLTLGLPVEAIFVILMFDRILDMLRTAINIWGDLIVAKIVNNYYENNLTSVFHRIIK